MKRSNAISAFSTLMVVAAFAASSDNAKAGGFIDAGIYTGVGTFGNGICGSPCGGLVGSQFNGLPQGLPRRPIAHQAPMMPVGPSGWVNTPGWGSGFPGGGFPGGGFPGGGWAGGFPGVGYPGFGNGYPGWGFPGNGFPGWGGNVGMPGIGMPGFGLQAGLGFPGAGFGMPGFGLGVQVPGGPCGISCFGGGGGGVVINARSPAAWEIPDTGFIIGAVGGALMNMNSNVFPVAYPRQAQTIPQMPHWTDNRGVGFEPRSGLHSNGGSSIFQ